MIEGVRGKEATRIAFDKVVSMISSGDGWIVTDTNGEEHRVSDSDWQLARDTFPVATFPALPGTYVVWCWEQEGRMDSARIAVLAWGQFCTGLIRPLTLDYEDDYRKEYYILHPDGRVESSMNRGFDTLEEWKREMAQERSDR